MFSLWTSLSQRIGTCASRLVQVTSMVLPPLSTSGTSSFHTFATHQRCLSNVSQQTLFHPLKCIADFLHPSNSCLAVTSQSRSVASFEYMHRKGLYAKVKRKRKHPLEGRPQMRGVVLKTLVKKPKKPNSANRKCVRLRLTSGKEVTAYVPGEGHNLQEHNIVLVEGGRLQDTPGVKLVCVRGKYDLPHVKKRA